MNHEDLSTLVDGETAADRRTALIDELAADREARAAWQRYHVIGDVLRAGGQAPAKPATVVELPRRERRAAGPLAGLAIAASVAALAVMFVLQRPGGDAGSTGFEVAESLPPAPRVAAAPAPATAAATTAEPAAMTGAGSEQRLNGYLVNFNEQRARLGVPGVHPYVRIVGFESR